MNDYINGSGRNLREKSGKNSANHSLFRSDSSSKLMEFAKSETSVEVWNALHSTNKIPNESPTTTNGNELKT